MKKQSKFKKLLYSQKVAPYVFVMPFIITFVVFFAYSIVSMIIMSFQKVAGPNTTFVGLENYKIDTELDEKEMRRLQGYLLRRGFSYSDIKSVLEDMNIRTTAW